MALKLEDAVSIKHTVLSGVVKGAAVDNVTLDMQYLVEYLDNEGEQQSRYFTLAQIEAE